MGYKEDRKWSNKSLPYAIKILEYQQSKEKIPKGSIEIASDEDDINKATDLIVLKIDLVRILYRIRRYDYLIQYGQQFTIRYDRPISGNKTEFEKIIEGYGNYMFYGFLNKEETKICYYHLLDLNIFRHWIYEEIRKNKGILPGFLKLNKNGSSNFLSFNIRDFPSTIKLCKGIDR